MDDAGFDPSVLFGVEQMLGEIPSGITDRIDNDTNELFISEMNHLLFIVLVITLREPSSIAEEYFQAACTGTVISRKMVLTTASCVAMYNQDYSLGQNVDADVEETAVFIRNAGFFRAQRIFVPLEYTRDKMDDFNFAVIEVENIPHVFYPSLPTKLAKDFNEMKQSCLLGGYGNLSTLSIENFHFMYLNDSGIISLHCWEPVQSYLKKICFHIDNLVPCTGDVGSPLICGDELFAIFTPISPIGPRTCPERYGFIFTPVFPVAHWLSKIIEVVHVSDAIRWIQEPKYVLMLTGALLVVILGIYCLIQRFTHRRLSSLSMDGEGPLPRALTSLSEGVELESPRSTRGSRGRSFNLSLLDPGSALNRLSSIVRSSVQRTSIELDLQEEEEQEQPREREKSQQLGEQNQDSKH